MNRKIELIAQSYGLYDAPEEELELFALDIINTCESVMSYEIEQKVGIEIANEVSLKLKQYFGVIP